MLLTSSNQTNFQNSYTIRKRTDCQENTILLLSMMPLYFTKFKSSNREENANKNPLVFTHIHFNTVSLLIYYWFIYYLNFCPY